MVYRKRAGLHEPSRFTEKTLFGLVDDMKTGRLPIQRQTISDDIVTGLRAIVSRSGSIALEASFHCGDERPMLWLGDLNKDSDEHLSIADARELTKTIKALGDKGIDPRHGLHKRLIAELMRQGTEWRPPAAEKKRAK